MNSRTRNINVVMLCHGETSLDTKDLFCGWHDAELTPKGEKSAAEAGKLLHKLGFKFDIAYTSVLIRASKTLEIILNEVGQPDIPIIKSWRLNEKHCGALTGFRHEDAVKKYGEEKVLLWKNSYSIAPPQMSQNHPYCNGIVDDARYSLELTPEKFPKSESLKNVMNRTISFWNEVITPNLSLRKKILIVAHRDTLKCIAKHLDNLNEHGVIRLQIPTCKPIVYMLGLDLKPVPNGSMNILVDTKSAENVKRKIDATSIIRPK